MDLKNIAKPASPATIRISVSNIVMSLAGNFQLLYLKGQKWQNAAL
jgi:uncharacterized protein YhhL (DUF1145 family)